MEKEEIINSLSKILIQIIDAKEEKNICEDNAKIAITDLMKLLNMSVIAISKQKQSETNIFNSYQDIWFKSINKAKKEIKYQLIQINDNLFRVYIMALFKKDNKKDLLLQATGWNYDNLSKEKITEDMKIILLSVINLKEEKINKN